MSGQVAVRCTDATCGLRYPAPRDDARTSTCPACLSPALVAETYPAPHNHASDRPGGVRLRGVLDNVRSALNVGTMLRAADGARLEHVHLCGVTPPGDHPKVTKTSLGAEQSVGWSHHRDATVAVDELGRADWVVWALESTPSSEPLSAAARDPLPQRLAFVVGNEVAGVDPALLRAADRHVHLPMFGAKTTLNVGVALGAAIYALRTVEASVSAR